MNANAAILRRRFFKERIPLYQKNPILFAEEVLKFEPDIWQQEALKIWRKRPRLL